ncbi:DUF305 domain-containing protein [Streptomyces montanisoli]|uniref:DUF305 domain-containing protein n=1 Tax=Streptomyces montanisoli TaxID=2798581 RepID=A0A940ME18_9ACTN|nr:DUF305 domain-containing protein [Streptomyces montanisoli]MBP0457872.1 DUF305 domain-containing protein [Streptomyces montanisoli]
MTTTTTTRQPARRALAAATALMAAALVLTACGGQDAGNGRPATGPASAATTAPAGSTASSSSPSAAPTGAHNAQDVAFAQAMIPHHRQAVTMARLAASRAGSSSVKSLAAGIARAQGPEITTMSGWLTAWGRPVPPAAAHSAHMGQGMMSDADMAALRKETGAAFDTAFLRMMIGHHRGAVAMAHKEHADGAYGPAQHLAASITSSQTAEIARMRTLLAAH